MNRDKKILYAFTAALFGALLLTLLFQNGLWQRIALAVVAVLSCVLVTLLIKKRSILKIEKWQVLWFLPVIGVIAIGFYFLFGLRFGWTSQTVAPSVIWERILPFAVIIGGFEWTRQALLSQNNKWVTGASFVIFVVLDAILLWEGEFVGNFKQTMEFVGFVLFPAVTSNVLYHFASKRYGMMPVAIYRLIMACYAYVLPVTPALPKAPLAFLRLLLPIAVFLFLRMLYERRRFVVAQKSVYVKTATTAVTMILMTLWIMLISCEFSYGLLVIATESMTGSIDRGDAIIYKEYNGEPIQEEQVVVYEKNGVTVIHRVVRVEHINGEVRYYTKGDFNENEDAGYITAQDIVGVTDVTLKYIGYPTLWMRDIFNR